jgi:hypothetical protein
MELKMVIGHCLDYSNRVFFPWTPILSHNIRGSKEGRLAGEMESSSRLYGGLDHGQMQRIPIY